MQPPYNRTPTTYYKPKSGVGRIITQKHETLPTGMHVGVIGLGAGTIAGYSNAGDTYRFYDINPMVIDIARLKFSYLSDSPAGIKTVLGDARLNLEREPAQAFDVLAIDAFSGDSIPVHLITFEALGVYLRHMKADGVIAFHVSNRFLDLKPVVQKIAAAHGLKSTWVRDTYEDGATSSDWLLLSRDVTQFEVPALKAAAQPLPEQPTWRMWTDDFNNVLQVLK